MKKLLFFYPPATQEDYEWKERHEKKEAMGMNVYEIMCSDLVAIFVAIVSYLLLEKRNGHVDSDKRKQKSILHARAGWKMNIRDCSSNSTLGGFR